MTTAGIKSHGTKIGIAAGTSPETYLELEECFAIGQLGGTTGLIDFSSHDSVDFRDYLAQSLAEGNDLPLQANYVEGAAAAAAFEAAYNDKEAHDFCLTLTNDKTRTFPAIITSWNEDFSELDGRVMVNFTLKLVGTIVKG